MYLARRSIIVIVSIIIAWAIYLPLADISRSEDGCDKSDCTYLPAAAVASDSQSGGLILSKSKIFRNQNQIILYAEAVNTADVRIHSPSITLIFRSAQNEIIHTMQTSPGILTALGPGERVAFNTAYYHAPYEIEPKLEYMTAWRTDEPGWHEAPSPIEVSNPHIVEVVNSFGVPQPVLEATIKNGNPVTVTVYLQSLAVYDDDELELVVGFPGGCNGCDELGPNKQIEVSAFLGELFEPIDFASIDPADIVVYTTGRIQEENCGPYCQ